MNLKGSVAVLDVRTCGTQERVPMCVFVRVCDTHSHTHLESETERQRENTHTYTHLRTGAQAWHTGARAGRNREAVREAFGGVYSVLKFHILRAVWPFGVLCGAHVRGAVERVVRQISLL